MWPIKIQLSRPLEYNLFRFTYKYLAVVSYLIRWWSSLDQIKVYQTDGQMFYFSWKDFCYMHSIQRDFIDAKEK